MECELSLLKDFHVVYVVVQRSALKRPKIDPHSLMTRVQKSTVLHPQATRLILLMYSNEDDVGVSIM